ncbi:MAG TPA: CbtB-domain containing protein [Stellaceae bacterium]|jgi:cobalt transporter subunit CbtB
MKKAKAVAAELPAAAPGRIAAERVAHAVPGVLAMMLGAFLVLGTGFAPIQAIHNAAHDVRHGFAFPCH